jgi:hypothetical protein
MQPEVAAAAHLVTDAAPAAEPAGQQGQQQEQPPEYEVAPEHQFRIVSSDEESSDSDNSNSGTGY